MGTYSGRCDLFDHISMEKMYDKGSYKTSDELECFNIFKQKTGGVIYQLVRVPLNEWNFDKFAEIEKAKERTTYKLEKDIKYLEVPDKRCKTGIRKVEDITYKVSYFNRTVEAKSLAEINKQISYYYRKEIRFDTIFDILPYYPYIITTAYSDKKREHVIVASQSYVESEFEELLQSGYVSIMYNHYKADLQKHYKELIDKYGDDLFNPDYKYVPKDDEREV